MFDATPCRTAEPVASTMPEKRLCFLVGVPRSGTTWLQRLIQAHPQVCGGEESNFFQMFAHPLRHAIVSVTANERKTGPLIYTTIREFDDQVRRVWLSIFARLYDTNPDAIVHLEKTPFHALCLNEIIRLFPDARIIVLLRDSRAVAASLVHTNGTWGENWAPGTYREAAILWFVYMRAIADWRRQNPGHPCLVVRYEDAVERPSEALREVLGFLDLDRDDATITATMHRFEQNDAAMRDPPGFKRKRGKDGWREDLPWQGRYLVWRYTRKMMRELGYECRLFA